MWWTAAFYLKSSTSRYTTRFCCGHVKFSRDGLNPKKFKLSWPVDTFSLIGDWGHWENGAWQPSREWVQTRALCFYCWNEFNFIFSPWEQGMFKANFIQEEIVEFCTYVCVLCVCVCVWCVCVCLCVCSLRLETLRTLNTSEQQQGFNVPQGETPFSTCTKLLLHSFYSWWIFLMWNKYCHHSIQTSARTHARTHTHRLGILVSWMLTRHLSQSRSNWVDSFNVVAQMRALSSALLTTSLVQVTLKHANHFKGTSLHTIQS